LGAVNIRDEEKEMRLTVFCANAECGGNPIPIGGKTFSVSHIMCNGCNSLDLTPLREISPIDAPVRGAYGEYTCPTCNTKPGYRGWHYSFGCPFCGGSRYVVASSSIPEADLITLFNDFDLL
jgi:hypothetical protein